MSVVYIAEVAIGIGFLILFHELGHFIVAKLSKVKVEGFSVGFGPELIGFTRGETRYSLRIVPLGGYVKMLGEEPGSDTAVDSRSFMSQPFRTKFSILAAGSVANILLALVLFVGVFQVGTTFSAARVGVVEYGLPAFYAGLQRGDRILEIDGQGEVDFEDFHARVALAEAGEEIELLVQRDGQTFPLTVRPEFDPSQGIATIGIEAYPTLTIGGFARQGAAGGEGRAGQYGQNPAEKAGVEAGWTITSANGQAVTSWVALTRAAVRNGLRPLGLTLSKDGAERTVTIMPARSLAPLLGITAFQTTEIAEVKEDSLAGRMGLQAGDRIVAVGDNPCVDMSQLRYIITSEAPDLPPLAVMRGGERIEIAWDSPPASGTEFCDGLSAKILPRAGWVMEGYPAEAMGMQAGDEVVSVDGQEVTDFESIRKYLRDSTGDTIAVEWKRGDEGMRGEFEPVFLGILPTPEQVTRKLGIVKAWEMGLRKAWASASQIFIVFRKLARREQAVGKKLSGPVGLAYISYQYAKQGFTRLVFLLAVITLNLGIINLLPVPILDGGVLTMCVVEKIRGRAFSLRTQAILQYLGLAVIVALFVYVTWQDVLRIPWPNALRAAWRFVVGVLHLG